MIAAEPPVEYSLRKANRILLNKADIEAYLETIRKELMQSI
jgi:hypothetical protein